ncbi:Inner membrane protein YjdF [compost metagenome]
MHGDRSYQRFYLTLAILFALVFGLFAISPQNWGDWVLENVLVLLMVLALAVSYRYFKFTRQSLLLIFLFLCVHELGAHYTYSRVPYDAWCKALTGETLNQAMGWRRNHFDRLVHLCYGLFLVYPIREIMRRCVTRRGIWSGFLAINLILSTSAVYELVEWVGGEFLGGDQSAAFVGAQDDIWDAQKDIALAGLGAALTLSALAWRERRKSAATAWNGTAHRLSARRK